MGWFRSAHQHKHYIHKRRGNDGPRQDTNDLIVCGLSIAEGTTATGLGISGGALTWNVQVTASRGSQVAAIAWAWAASTITSQTITASWTNNNNGALACRAVSGSKDYTGLTPGTNYATVTKTTPACSNCTISITPVGTGSWAVCSGNQWSSTSVTANAGTTVMYSFVPGGGETARLAHDSKCGHPFGWSKYAWCNYEW